MKFGCLVRPVAARAGHLRNGAAARMRIGTAARVCLLALAAGLAACSEDAATPEQAAPSAASFSEAVVETVSIEEPVVGTGTIAPLQRTDLGPRVDGIIEKIYVRVGARVKKGDPLFKTRDTELRLKVDELKNQVKLARANVEEARRNFDRISSLAARGVASAGALDRAHAALESAEAQLGVAKAKLAQAQQMLEDTVVRAPYDGVITARNVHEGKFMATRMGGGMGGPGGVVEIMEIHTVAAIVEVPEVHLSRFGIGTPAKVLVDGLDEEFESEVHRINDYIDPVKRTIEVRIGIANPDYKIKPGSFARAYIYPPPRTALALPRAAVLGFEGNQHVFVARDGVAVRVPVRARDLDAERVEILEGLEPGARVLIGPGLRTLVEGDPVTVTPPGDGTAVSAAG